MARVRHAHTVKLPSNGPSHGAKRTPTIRQMQKPPSHITHITPLPVPPKLPSLFYHNQGMRLPASDSSTAVSAVGNTYKPLPLHTCSLALYSASQLHYSAPPPALPALVPVERLRATVYLTKASACLFTTKMPSTHVSLVAGKAVSWGVAHHLVKSSVDCISAVTRIVILLGLWLAN